MSSLSERPGEGSETLFRRVAGRRCRFLPTWISPWRTTGTGETERLADAITEYVASKKHEHEQDLLSISSSCGSAAT